MVLLVMVKIMVFEKFIKDLLKTDQSKYGHQRNKAVDLGNNKKKTQLDTKKNK